MSLVENHVISKQLRKALVGKKSLKQWLTKTRIPLYGLQQSLSMFFATTQQAIKTPKPIKSF